jgi:D-sedoheptulose 7-phosphate isomerase
MHQAIDNMLQQKVTDYFATLYQLLNSIEVTDQHGATLSLEKGAENAVKMILAVKTANQKVLLAGNGGSASIVSHVQNDLCKAAGVRAMVFTEQPLLTALANDDGYGSVFEWPICLWAEPGDLLLTVSSSGQSENIVRALAAAREKECLVITLSGFDPDNTSRQMGDLNFYVPSHVYGYVETAHTALAHFLTSMAVAC